MKSKFKIYSNWKLGLYKFIGDVNVEDILNLLEEGYSDKHFNTINYTLLDFRDCSFTFELHDVTRIVALVEKNTNIKYNYDRFAIEDPVFFEKNKIQFTEVK